MPNWFARLVNRRGADRSGAQAHMTFGQTSIGRSISRTSLLLKRQLWIWPIVAVVLLAIIGFTVSVAIHRTMEDTLRSQLETLLSVERSMLERWFAVQESSAQSLANNQQVRRTVTALLAAKAASEKKGEAGGANATALDEMRDRLSKELDPGISSYDFVGFIVTDKQQQIVAANRSELIGRTVPQYESFLARALEGKPNVSAPFASVVTLKDELGRSRTGTPTMFVCAPVRDDDLQVVGALALRIRPEKEFTDILQLGRIGSTGETYAVNKDGLMVSNSRFDEGLILLGLLPDDDAAASILSIQVRDPGGNMVEGFRPGVRRRELPLTEIASAAVSGTTGVNMQGYRDYRGSPSVGAWTWLPNHGLGIITEIDIAEAYRPLSILKYAFYSLYSLLALGAAAIFVFTLVVARLQRQARKATIEAKQLGQYRLEKKIGAGAMGVVYKGQHAMLRRPTAIKMLDVDRVDEASVQRFEREVQITCNLNNPHTVAIYDYGHTPEGVFYYAMEYLDGIDLQTLVDQYGPQPEGRVVSILRQVCASLYEAHSLGLVHRDIKPANIMLNRRGAEPDVVKVLDFGLVKALHESKEGEQGGHDLSGTPLYMSPEAIQTPELVDARSDLYAVGAVGYFLLTGQTAFSAHTLGELCQQHLSAIPDAPSQRVGHAISQELEHAILACLEKGRAKRPQTARDLATLLDRVTAAWTLDDAEGWWSRHERGQQTPGRPGLSLPSSPAAGPAASSGNPSAASPPRGAADTSAAPSNFDQTTVFTSPEDLNE
jgi:eukaryotic-like serine/threonine-protein kinase